MNQQSIVNILLGVQTFIGLLVAIRAFYLYARNRSDELAILGLAMLTLAVTGVIGLLADNFWISTSQLLGDAVNTTLFRYSAQAMSYLFILLSTLRGSGNYTRQLKRWYIAVTVLLIILLLLTPITPPFPSPFVQASLSASRSLICFLIFFRYVTLFFEKETRFSFIMALSFLLLTLGISLITPQFFPDLPPLYIYLGHSLRVAGLISLFLAFFVG